MTAPTLLIFDIDGTLLRPHSHYTTPEQVRQGLYDPIFLSQFLSNPIYQVALASFNHDLPGTSRIGGRRLGRTILDTNLPNSDAVVEDDFIQAWMHPTWEQMLQVGKNVHIRLILYAYYQKYGRGPPTVVFYDDCIENVYLANSLIKEFPIKAYWVTRGLTVQNINTFDAIGRRVRFKVKRGELGNNVHPFSKYIFRDPDGTFLLYLPCDGIFANAIYQSFLAKADDHNIKLTILEA